MTSRPAPKKPHIVVLGAGFAGLQFCQHFPRDIARITLIDKHNHHLFQPLLYQVAMAGLSAPDISEPIRSIFRRRKDITVLMDEARAIDLEARQVHICDEALDYDHLIIALGAVTSYFGNDHWATHALGLKTVTDALEIRRRILTSFERAESTGSDEERRKLMTIVVVGGGPTGVELAGTMAELANHVFHRDFRRMDPRDAKVILIDGGDRLLSTYPESLSQAAKEQLEELGVEVRLQQRVVNVAHDHVELRGGDRIDTYNILWGAGVAAHPITRTLGVETGPGGRLKVKADLSLPDHPEVFAVGDIVTLEDVEGRLVPGVAPAAMQMGRHVAKLLADEIRATDHPREAAPQRPGFRYTDKGSMATIGRNRAVAWVGRFKFTGFLAWLAWLFVHLLFLVSFRDKVAVLMEWGFNYFSYRRGARIIFSAACGAPAAVPADPDSAHPNPRHPANVQAHDNQAAQPTPAAHD